MIGFAWNEWGEGAVLENYDQEKFGYLNALGRVVNQYRDENNVKNEQKIKKKTKLSNRTGSMDDSFVSGSLTCLVINISLQTRLLISYNQGLIASIKVCLMLGVVIATGIFYDRRILRR